MKPIRIQLSRKKGWRKPANTVVVARPSKWANPFRLFGRSEYLYCDASHRRKSFTPWVIFDHEQDIVKNPATTATAVSHFREWLTGKFDAAGIIRPCEITDRITELRGKNLACWCPLPKPGEPDICHAAILLEIANS